MADCRWAGAEVVWRAWRHLQQQLLQVAHVAVAVHVQAGALPYRQPCPIDDGRVVQRVREDVAAVGARQRCYRAGVGRKARRK